ncbi:MAG: cystathionine gamma-synthase [Bdellovibrionales bacterium]|nr:cystathionine gamma-synthase [Bdellovibrionales bacterium]
MYEKNKLATAVIHEGQEPDPLTGAVVPPIYQTSTYVQSAPGVHKGYEYSRTHNPTRKNFETAIAAAESAKYGHAFSSGMAAITTVLHTLEQNAHVICCDDVYGGTYRLFSKVLAHRGFSFDFVDCTNVQNIEKAITPKTKMIWIETPTNPLLKLIDIEAVASLAKKKNLMLVVDNTFATPYVQRPIELGADIVVHSTTKYIGGHSDVVGGAAVTSDQTLAEKIGFYLNSMGTNPGPFDSWLTHRGLKTLCVRMKQHCENAQAIAEYLEKHAKVEKVLYPGLPSHPQHQLAKKQMHGFGGMIGCYLRMDLEQAKSFLSKTKLFALAESLGGVESLIEHPAIMTHASVPKENREKLGITDGFVRLSVGIEDAQDLMDDLKQALA